MAGPRVGRVVGTAGHIDHGKTELVAALTGVATDRLPEERERGISIDLGFAPLDLGPGVPPTSVVDVPGHEDFVRNMVAGATGIDAVLFVVAADEGMMPQSREHLLVLDALRVDRGVVAVTKTDLVEGEWAELVAETVREEIADSGLAGAPIRLVSARTGEGIEALRDALAGVLREPVPRETGRFPFRLPVDRAFLVTGAGTVTTGTVWSGSVSEGDTVSAFPAGAGARERPLAARVRTIEVHGEEVDRVSAGRRAALALAGVDSDALGRGTVLAGPERPWRPVDTIDAEIWLGPEAPRPLERGARIRVHHGTREVMGRAWWYAEEAVAPGAGAVARLALEAPIVPAVGDPLVVRAYSPVETIGGGEVLALEPPRVRGSERVDRAVRLAALADARGSERLALALAAAGAGGIPEPELPLATGLGGDALARARAADDVAVEAHGGRWFARAARERTMERILAALRAHHAGEPLQPGMPLEAARQSARSARPALVEAAIERLVEIGAVERRGSGGTALALADHRVELVDGDRELAGRIREAYASAGIEPPGTDGLVDRLDADPARVRELLRHLEREGELVKLASDWYADADALARAERRVVERLERDGAAGVGELKELFGVSRKYLIPLLEWFDRRGVTRREGDRRVLAEGS
ncbi:MAG: selenocysteine-specific translation elongation factor [Gemmatimonadota bacterium]|nr:selenocysteine-specific translation elongation factor [Gemmatimonadota bacterium]